MRKKESAICFLKWANCAFCLLLLLFFSRVTRANRSHCYFLKSDRSESLFWLFFTEQRKWFGLGAWATRAIWEQFTNFLGIKRGKAWWKERIWSKSCWKDRITVKKSQLLFQIERISPVPLYLKMTFSPVVLYKTSNGSNLVSFFLLRATGVIRSSCSFCKEWPEWFAPVTLFVKSDRSNSVQSLFWKRAAGWFAPVPVPFLKEQKEQ